VEQSVEYVLKNFPGTRYYPKFKLTTWHPQGAFNAALADKILAFIEWEEYIQDTPFDRYTDLSGLADIRIGIGSMIESSSNRSLELLISLAADPHRKDVDAEKPELRI
jgi:hypothetical protein